MSNQKKVFNRAAEARELNARSTPDADPEDTDDLLSDLNDRHLILAVCPCCEKQHLMCHSMILFLTRYLQTKVPEIERVEEIETTIQ